MIPCNGNYNPANVDWLICRIKEALKEWETMQHDFDSLEDAFNDLKTYVDNYLLPDVISENIYEWLDNAISSGELLNMFKEFAYRPFNTVNDLLISTSISDGVICKVLGYNEVNDGGSFTCIIKSEIPESLYIKLNNGLYAMIIYNDYIYPQWFGCVGDAKTDDSENMQKCIDYAISKRVDIILNRMHLLKTDVVINGQLNINSMDDCGFKCEGGCIRVEKPDGIVYEVRLKNFLIHCDNSVDYGLILNNASQVFIDNLYIEKARLANLKSNNSLIYIENSYMYYSMYGMEITGNYYVIRNCNFWKNTYNIHLTGNIGQLSFLNSWFEEFTEMIICDDNVTGNALLDFIQCSFIGTAVNSLCSKNFPSGFSFNMFIKDSRINMPNMTNPLFTLSAQTNCKIKLIDSYVYLASSVALVNNDNNTVNKKNLMQIEMHGNAGTGLMPISDDTKGLVLNLYNNYVGDSIAPNGITFGNKIVAYNNVKEGFVRYSGDDHRLKVATADNQQQTIPVKSTTYISPLSTSAELNDVIEIINKLLNVLRDECTVLN